MLFFKSISNQILKKFNSKKLQLHEPVFSKSRKKNLKDCIDSGFVSTSSNGFFIKKLEKQIKRFTKSRYAICTINGVSGIHASLLALDIKKDQEILVPSLTFVATVHPILYLGAIPHFVEVEEKNFGICPNKLEKYLKSNSYKKGQNLYNKKTNRN